MAMSSGKSALVLALLACCYVFREEAVLGEADPTEAVPRPAKRDLTAKDYKRWEQLGEVAISDDGRWCAYGVRGPAGQRLIFRNLDSERKYEAAGGSSPVFAFDSEYVAYQLPGGRLEVLDLGTGRKKLFEGMQAPPEVLSRGDYLLLRRTREEKNGGFSLLGLKNGTESPLQATRAVARDATGRFLALTVALAGENRIELLNLQTMVRKTLYKTPHALGPVMFAPNNEAILTTETVPSKAGPREVSIGVLQPLTPSPTTERFDPSEHSEFPKDRQLAGPLIPIPGGRVKAFLVQTVAIAVSRPGPGGKPDEERVAIHHGDNDKKHSRDRGDGPADFEEGLYLWLPTDRKMLPVDGEPVAPDFRYTLSHRKSSVPESWNLTDLYVTDLHDGKKVLLADQAEGSNHPFHPVALYYRNGHWWQYDFNSRQTTNLTMGLPERFDARTYGSFETAGSCPAEMLSDGSMLLGGRYDLYLWTYGQGLRRLTDGAKSRTVYRLVRGQVARAFPDGTRPDRLFFTAFNERTKQHGFAVWEAGATKTELRAMQDRNLFLSDREAGDRPELVWAKSADRVIVQRSSFAEPPNLYLTDSQFRKWTRITDLNPQQSAYHWGKAELVSCQSSWGADLGGVLIYPAHYQPGKLHPMVVYVYELQSDQLHDYIQPDEGDWANEQVLSQRGYFVLKPDIDYRPGSPGPSAVDCVEAAVRAVLKKRVVDPKRIGLMGTSFGGYETTFLLGKSRMFAAGVALNPVTNLISKYSFDSAKETGGQRAELGQFRMGVPYWQDLQRYVDNSPIFHAEEINAPLLLVHGDVDAMVPWQQSREMYEAMRRAKKKVTLLIYPGVGHGPFGPGLAHRVRHFLDVYLQGAKPEPWLP